MERIIFAVAHIMLCCRGLSPSHPHVPSRGKDSVWDTGDSDTYSLEPEKSTSSLGVGHLLHVRCY